MNKDIESVIRIDEERLDREWLVQGEHVLTWTTYQADARHEHAQAEAKLDLVEADLFLRIKSDPTEFGFTDKPTVDALKACVITRPEYQEAQRAVMEAKHTLDLHGAAVAALDGKKKGLENLVQLLTMNYHSNPKPPADPAAREAFQESQRKAALGGNVDRRKAK